MHGAPVLKQPVKKTQILKLDALLQQMCKKPSRVALSQEYDIVLSRLWVVPTLKSFFFLEAMYSSSCIVRHC